MNACHQLILPADPEDLFSDGAAGFCMAMMAGPPPPPLFVPKKRCCHVFWREFRFIFPVPNGHLPKEWCWPRLSLLRCWPSLLTSDVLNVTEQVHCQPPSQLSGD